MDTARYRLQNLIENEALASITVGERRREIAQTILAESPEISEPNFRSLASRDVQFLFDLYDELFFDQLCRETIAYNGDQLRFRVSKRMTSAGGKTTVETTHELVPDPRNGDRFSKRDFEIAISAVLLFGSQFSDNNQPVTVAGVACANRLDALLRIIEHEMIHLIEFLVWNDSSCAASRFRQIALNFFGHRQSSHQLITPTESAELEQGIGIGDYVGFHHAGHQYAGYVNHIYRRATVLVPHRKGTPYADGKRYAKFYVPLDKLRRLPK